MSPFWARRVTVALAALIGLATLTPVQQLPDAPGTDKLHHVIAFAVLVLPMSFAKLHQFCKSYRGIICRSSLLIQLRFLHGENEKT